jgi:hypothetical protein
MHRFTMRWMLLLAALYACGNARPGAEVEPHAPASPREPVSAPGLASAPEPQLFGAALDPETPELTLADLLASPAQHAGRTIRAEGTIERVCQRMGCWMEIRGDGAPSAVRVPMAGHAFFLPQHVAGRRAMVQGQVSIAPISDAHKQHLKEEGALATDVDVSIVATGVKVL